MYVTVLPGDRQAWPLGEASGGGSRLGGLGDIWAPNTGEVFVDLDAAVVVGGIDGGRGVGGGSSFSSSKKPPDRLMNSLPSSSYCSWSLFFRIRKSLADNWGYFGVIMTMDPSRVSKEDGAKPKGSKRRCEVAENDVDSIQIWNHRFMTMNRTLKQYS